MKRKLGDYWGGMTAQPRKGSARSELEAPALGVPRAASLNAAQDSAGMVGLELRGRPPHYPGGHPGGNPGPNDTPSTTNARGKV